MTTYNEDEARKAAIELYKLEEDGQGWVDGATGFLAGAQWQAEQGPRIEWDEVPKEGQQYVILGCVEFCELPDYLTTPEPGRYYFNGIEEPYTDEDKPDPRGWPRLVLPV